MFKLAKIEGSGTNQAEPIRIRTAPDLPYKAFCAYTLFDGFLAEADTEQPPTHIVLENLEPNEKETILCYRIQDNMVFEVTISGSFPQLSVGNKHALKVSDEGAGVGITSAIGGKITLHDINGARKSGDTVYVRIEK